jgi:putative membrane protein
VSDQPGASFPPDAQPPTPHQSPPYGPAHGAAGTEATPTIDAPLAAGLTTGLADGEWHRLHPATPLLRGGIALLAILGFVLNSFRERLIETFTGNGNAEGDPFEWILSHGYVGIALGITALGLVLFIAGFYLSWRMHTFRITNEVVEVRSGILFRTNRRGRLDRIQGINIVRPLIARLFGAAKLEVNVAGEDANVQLSYLASRQADDLRRDILRLASGTQAGTRAGTRGAPDAAGQPSAGAPVAPRGFVDQRVSELLAPELDPDLAPPESVVKMNTGRLVGSLLLNDTTVVFVILLVGAIITSVAIGELFPLFTLAPVLIGMGSFLFSRFTKSLRYSIAGTPDGVRVGFGLFTTSNETLPPGRIHSIQVSQPLLWRMTGWWEIKVNRASKSSTQGASGQQNTTILPVGNLDDVMRVLGLLLPDTHAPEMLERGLMSPGGDDGFVNSPRRAAPLRWFSWRRNGYAFSPGTVLLRKGRIWRELIIVPEPRVQSVALHQGPLLRRFQLASITLHTVAGPITARLGAVDQNDAREFFETASRSIVDSALTDTSHRWRSAERAAVPSAEPIEERSADRSAAAPNVTTPSATTHSSTENSTHNSGEVSP